MYCFLYVIIINTVSVLIFNCIVSFYFNKKNPTFCLRLGTILGTIIEDDSIE